MKIILNIYKHIEILQRKKISIDLYMINKSLMGNENEKCYNKCQTTVKTSTGGILTTNI